ncbi:MAG: nickel-dependent hydrogenase large subunit [Elusimicrobiota bacterium]
MKVETYEKVVNIPANRVEGDLEVKVAFENGAVSEAWSAGIMFRGIENILVGRAAMDALVLTSRICGLCSVSHLTAAARALDMISGAKVPDNGKRLRNVCLMTEHIQGDMRHGFLMFTADFVNPAYKDLPLYDEAVRRYEPFKGETVIEAIKETKRAVEIIAILGGQWPHSAFMVPGGVAWNPTPGDLLQCRNLLGRYRQWYEERVLGCSLDRWRQVKSASDLDAWLKESDVHRDSDLGFYIRFSRQAGLDRIGKGYGNFLSYGSLPMPDRTSISVNGKGPQLTPAGFAEGTKGRPFDEKKVSEHVTHSWFRDYEGGRHPFEGETKPYATGGEAEKYSWAKAPRYDGAPAETGPLAERMVAGDPLFTDLAGKDGPNVFVRELARLLRPATLMPAMDTWLREMMQDHGPYYVKPGEIKDGQGCGLVHAARGALGHWVKVEDGKIKHYQVITPTAWHASPRDSQLRRGPWEEALVGTKVRDVENPVEVGHVLRSYDPCMVCCVHTLRKGRPSGKVRV